MPIISKKDNNQFNLALSFQNKNNFQEAIKIYKKLLIKNPDLIEIKINLALCLFGVEKYIDAAEIFHKLHEDDPENVLYLNYCAVTYIKCNHNKIALDFLKRIIKLEPQNIEAWVNLTYVSSLLENHTESLYYATQALSLNPNETKLFNNMGSALLTIHRYQDALICYQTALDLDKNNISALTNIATILDAQGYYQESIIKYQEVLSNYALNDQEVTEIQYRMSFPLLGSGNLKLGWEYHDKGFEILGGKGRNPVRHFKKPLWDGQTIRGKRLLIWREQGIGDEVFYSALISEVLDYCDDVIIECSERLVTLFQRSFPTCTVRKDNSLSYDPNYEDFDYHIPVGSLCKLFRSSWEHFPTNKAYIRPTDQLHNKFRSRLSIFKDKLLVGISWRSGRLLTTRNKSYAPISDWKSILELENIKFVNLQYGECTDELNSVKEHYGIEIFNFEDIDIKNDLESLAAIISNLDLVISVSTFAAPFTESLGIPLKLIHYKNWCMLGKAKWPWSDNVEQYCPASLAEPISSVFDQVAKDITMQKK